MAAQFRDTELFRFVSRALPDETLHVIRFQGREGINELFSFTIELVSPNMSLDTEKLLSDRAVFHITREDGTQAVFNGYPSRVEQGGAFNGYCYYTVELRPALWKMTQIVQSRLFLNQTLGETLTELLRSEPFFSFPFALDFAGTDYPRREFAMQYEESVYDYLAWRLEEQGAYYYFEQSEERDTLHFADGPTAHLAAHTAVLRYAPVSGLEGARISENVIAFRLSQSQMPRRVVIRSYSWTNPNKPIVGSAPVSGNGLGDVYLTGEDVESDAEAGRLARLRAEARRCQARRFTGASAAPDLRPGYTFRLEGHHNAALNQEYLVTQVTHEGSQESFINLGLGIPLEGLSDHLFYRNDFACIEAHIPFRPQRNAPRAKISGVIHAFIDGASDGSRPEIDAYGRYKLLFPFDVSGRGEGKASCWIRRAQEQVGKNSGASFPLLNGTEVLVSFMDGNPDKPYITGALANMETGALTGSGNKNVSGFSTAGGNQLIFNDSQKKQGVGLLTPSGSGLVMSAGSLDTTLATHSFGLDVAKLSGTTIANVSHNVFSGNTILQEVVRPGKFFKYFFPVMEVAQEVVGGMAEKFQEDDPEGTTLPIILSCLKSFLSAVTTVGEVYVWKEDRASIYGFTARSGKDGTMTKLQTPKHWAETLANAVASVVGGLANAVDNAQQEGQDKKELEEKQEDNQREIDQIEREKGLFASEKDYENARDELLKIKFDLDEQAKKYDEQAKKAALITTGAQTSADVIAEIVAGFLVYKMTGNLDAEKMGGILLHSVDANIGLHAKDAIHLDTEGGLLLRSGREDVLNKLTSGYSDLKRNEPILKWGSKDSTLPNFTVKGLFNFYESDAMTYLFGPDADEEVIQRKGFLADISNLRYTDALSLSEYVCTVRKSVAGTHILIAGKSDEGSALVIKDYNGGYAADGSIQAPTDDNGIYLTVKGASHQTIRLDGNTFSVTLNDESVEIKKKKGGFPSVKVESDKITLAQSDSTSVTMTAQKVETKAGDSTVTVENGKIDLQNTGHQYNVGKFQFTVNDISQGEKMLNLAGGTIKIMG
ncbi:MAG: type VI secretion system Vgr family protein [Opitutaceae bacterium]|jgi:type VI secretion system VgrG family protein|nr:type VI secretion system Vgr family protein [Opitutaceae bacterium]